MGLGTSAPNRGSAGCRQVDGRRALESIAAPRVALRVSFQRRRAPHHQEISSFAFGRQGVFRVTREVSRLRRAPLLVEHGNFPACPTWYSARAPDSSPRGNRREANLPPSVHVPEAKSGLRCPMLVSIEICAIARPAWPSRHPRDSASSLRHFPPPDEHWSHPEC